MFNNHGREGLILEGFVKRYVFDLVVGELKNVVRWGKAQMQRREYMTFEGILRQ